MTVFGTLCGLLFRASSTKVGGRPRRSAARVLARVAVLVVTVLLPAVAAVPGAAVVASSPIVLSIAGQNVVFSTTGWAGTIYLSQNGYAYENPGFDFETGKETSGLNATPDIAIQTGLASPYAVVGAFALVPASGRIASITTSASIVPQVNELLVVLDSKGRYVLVQIKAVSPNALSFAYTFGAPENRPSALGNAVWVLGHQLTFPDSALNGRITLSANGEASVSPGFNFELHRQVSTLEQEAGLSAGVGTSGSITMAGDLAVVGANGHASAWPEPKSVAPVEGSLYLLVDNAGNYVLLQVTAVSATAISFAYRLLPARDVPVLPGGSVTLRIAGAAVTFSGPPRYGEILASAGGNALINPGFDLERDREVSGLSANPDITLKEQGGALFLHGTAATFDQLSAGHAPVMSDVAATPLTRFVAVDGAGNYVLVGVESATDQAIAFAYEIEMTGATAALQPPNPATVPSPPKSKSAGTLVYSVYTGTGVNFGSEDGYDQATGEYLSGGAMQLLKTYAFAIDPYKIWGFAGTTAVQVPTLSPDGMWLATISGSNILVRSVRGGDRTIATNGNVMGGALPAVSWSPDSRYLAYTGMVSEGGYEAGDALWVVEPSTGKSRLVVDPMRTGLHVMYVGWLPHDRLVFSTTKAFYAVSADWTRVVKLPVNAGVMGQNGRFDVSHDGTMVTWVARDAKGHYQVIVATIDGKQRVQFTTTRWDNWSPHFSPDDSMVVYVSNTGPPPGGELWGFTLNASQIGYLDAPGSKNPITHVFDLEEWFAAGSAAGWRGP